MEDRQKVVFFSMPFGLKPVDGGIYDFDSTWKEVLRPATPEGWSSLRIDEVATPGKIPAQFMELLRSADVAVFDLTTTNPNVLYELGVRDVFAPGRRVLVARVGTVPPFNVATERVLHYAADPSEARNSDFCDRLKRAILEIAGETIVRNRTAPEESRLLRQLHRAQNTPSLVAIWEDWKFYRRVPVDPLLQLADAFSRLRRLDLAIDVARRAYQESPSEWEVARTLGWYLRRNGQHDDAGELFNQALATNPRDIEAMGMLGGMYKRRAMDLLEQEPTNAQSWLAKSRAMYMSAVTIDPKDVYNLVNAGALSYIIGDEKMEAYETIVNLVGQEPRSAPTWDLLALGEASLALGMRDKGLGAYTDATMRVDFTSEMGQSASEQLRILEKFGLNGSDVADACIVLSGKKPISRKGITFIHLSDIHFGRKPSAGSGIEMHRFRKRSDLHDVRSLAQHIVDECVTEVHPDITVFVVVSGDIAYQATKDEYAEAAEFLAQLASGLGLPREKFVVVPGNHDVNWKLSELDGSQRFDTYLTFVEEFYGDIFRGVYPYVKWDFKVGSARPAPSEIVSVCRDQASKTVLVGFNSCALEDNKRHFGAIGKQQLNNVERQLNGIDESWLKVAVMHHHVLPLESRLSLGDDGAAMDGTLVRDYSLVERELHKLGFDLVLHGHKHEPGIRVSQLVNAFGPEGGKSLIVCGAGSAGVDRDELPDDWGNHFAIYRVAGPRRTGEQFVDIEWRELPYNDIHSKWVPRGRWKVPG